ncbi:DNA mismatch repair protein MutS [Halovulum dunhuangense]|uniref:DNA mismatch repair protein MutS n=1 Tax=Halovulum dunhuangense TaxID=1505036 RepID=A0A849KPW8_9RHOB|nr:Smr/MutS family protein [Halovulum dunhuangense]NNU79103.1 DNA mismatch repair protein MutS [Halovulum dunhuangense]
MRRKPRKLTSEERRLWSQIAQTATPLREAKPLEPPAQAPDDHPLSPSGTETTSSFPFGLPRRRARPEPAVRLDLAPDPMKAPDMLGPPRMDARAYGRMTRGKLAPEARIDLHGMTMDRAHDALRSFILSSHARGLRLVLVITGKGRDRPDEDWANPARRGVLRNAVPQWLQLAPLSMLVLQIAPAHIRHGGGGAYYVYLRKQG